MADFDDDLPEPESPGGDPPRRRRGRIGFRRNRQEPETDGSTGEVPRDDEPPIPEDFGFEDYEDVSGEVPPPRAREERASGGTRTRAGRKGKRKGGRGRPSGKGRGGRGKSGGGPAVLQQPAMRLLLGLVLAGILILVIVLVVRDCQRNALVDSYEEYMSEVATLTSESAAQGEQLRTILNNGDGQNAPQLQQQVRALAGEAQALVDRADGLDPPGKLNSANGSLTTVLEYRVTGLESLADGIPQAIESNDGNFAGSIIATPMQRFLASDVIYDDSFVGPAQRALEDDDISGIEVPEPEPFLANAAWASTAGARTLLPRLRGRGAGGDDGDDQQGTLRGTELIKTEALPSGAQLTTGNPVTIQASEQLAWRATVENGGDVTLEGVVVTATFTYPDTPNEPQTREAEIPSIEPGQQTSVELPGPTDLSFGDPAVLKIDVQPVSGEGNTDNNSAEYPVTITI